MTLMQKLFNEIHAELEPVLEAMRVADAGMIGIQGRGYNDGTVASTDRRRRVCRATRKRGRR